MIRWIKKRREQQAAHRVAIKAAREVYDRYKGQSVVVTEGRGFISAASPSREAWDSYFDSMLEQGASAWATQRSFDRALKRWKAKK